MPWVRFADDYLSNAKVVTLGPLARLLDVSAIIYAARELRDGQLSQLDVQLVARLAGIPKWGQAAAELVEAGRWTPCAAGFAIHDYLTYQPSRAQVLRKRAADAERMRKARSPGERHAGVRANVAPDSGPESRRSSRVPDPDPDAKRPLSSSPARARAANGALPRRAPGQDGPDPDPPPLRPGQQQCPLCPEVFPDNVSVRHHLDSSPRHKVRPEPEDFKAKPATTNALPPTVSEAQIAAELAAMTARKLIVATDLPAEILAEHEHLLAAERARRGNS